MAIIATNLQAVRARVARAAIAAGRHPDDVKLVAVSKTFPAEDIAQARAAGQRAFGENYVREAVEKITQLNDSALEWRAAQMRRKNGIDQSDAHPSAGAASPEGTLLLPLEWHFIGPVQSNKTGDIAVHFQWIHCVTREKIAQRLDVARPEELPALNVCIQVNVSGESAKSGVAEGEELKLADAIVRLPRLRLRGLMAIPEPTPDTRLQRQRFARLRELKDRLAAHGHAVDTLSMGMSDDLEAAIAEGATMVRVGTAIFGKRER